MFFLDLFLFNFRGELLISYFLVFHIIFPLYNIYRGFSLSSFNIHFLWIILLIFIFFFYFLKKNRKVFNSVLSLIFHPVIFKWRIFFSSGALFLKNYPKLFGLFICVSLSSLYCIKNYPDISWIYPIYFLCVVFRNVFIVPVAGYGFLINMTKKLDEKFKKSPQFLQNDTSSSFLVFKVMEKNNSLKFQLNLWSHWIDSLKPTLKSTRTGFWSSVFTAIFWNCAFYFHLVGKNLKESFENQKRIFYENTHSVLSYDVHFLDFQSKNKLKILKKISVNMEKKMENLNDEFLFFFKQNTLFLGLKNLIGNLELINLLKKNEILIDDSIEMKYFLDLLDSSEIFNSTRFKKLIKTYLPEELEKNENHFFKSFNFLKDFSFVKKIWNFFFNF